MEETTSNVGNISRKGWYTFMRLVLYVVAILALGFIVCGGNHGCTPGSSVTAPYPDAGTVDSGNATNDNNTGACSDEERASLHVESLYGGQVVCRGSEEFFDEAAEVSGICMSNSGFSFVVYTEGPSTLTASYEDGGSATLEFRVGTAPPTLQSEVKLDWGAVVVVTVP
jgi:hypothetical protein